MAAVIRYNPWSLLRDIKDEMNQAFDRNIKDQKTECTRSFQVDISEDSNNYLVHADLPGIDPKDIQISIEGNTLSIKGERKFERKHEDKEYEHQERFEGTYFRQFTLPEGVNSEKIEASGKNGVLAVIIPKLEPKKPKKIEVKVAG